MEIDRAYYMPTPADGSVRALRRWIQRFGGPKWLVPGLASTLPPLERDRRRLLDRYDSHTKHCKVGGYGRVVGWVVGVWERWGCVD